MSQFGGNLFPDTSMMIPIHFKVIKADTIVENIEVNFIEQIESIKIQKKIH